MPEKSFSNELAAILRRPDVEELKRILDVYKMWNRHGEEFPDECHIMMDVAFDDHDRAFAFIMLAASEYDDPDFLGLMAAGALEDLLQEASDAMVQRILDEARKSPRIRWMLSIVYLHALPVSLRPAVANAVNGWTGEHPLPPKIWA